MSSDLLDDDGLLPDTRFSTFVKTEKLYTYLILNLGFFLCVVLYLMGPISLTNSIYLALIYMLNNFWLVTAYLGWRKEVRKNHDGSR